MSKKKKPVKKETEDKLHEMSHEVFEMAAEASHDNIGDVLSAAVDQFKENVTDDNRFRYVISPLIAAHFHALADFAYHTGYDKGECLEMMADFWDQALENDDSEHECPHCAAEAAEAEKSAGPNLKLVPPVNKKDIN